MQKVLRKRVIRDLKENLLRYLALGFLIILCMYLIIGLVGAAETVIHGINEHAAMNKVEDGQFSVFVPLDTATEKEIKNQGVSLEEMFYLDYQLKDNSTLRIFKNRELINLIELDDGKLASNKNEIVLEKRYAEENELSVGDEVSIDSYHYTITGIGSVPDYDAPYKEMSDNCVDSDSFGIGFLTEVGYEELKNAGISGKTEEYVYAYRLNGEKTDDELKQLVKDMKFSANQVKDTYFQDYWKENVGKKDDMKEGIHGIADGSEKMSDSLSELSKNNSSLKNGATIIFESSVTQSNQELKEAGINQTLTTSNYADVLKNIINSSDDAIIKLSLNNALEQLTALDQYQQGVSAYTDGVSDIADGSVKLLDGILELQNNTDEILDKLFEVKLSNLTQFVKMSENPRIKASSGDQVINKLAGLIAGVIIMILFTYVISVFVIHGIEKESSVIGALYALGVKKKDLMFHYLVLPIVVAGVAGIIGTVIGFSPLGIKTQMQECYDYFSVPQLKTFYSVYLVIYGVAMPPVAAVIVNCLVIQKKLSKPALQLIRNEQKRSKISNVNLGNMGFIRRLQIRQILRELRTGFTVIFGMLISLLIVMLGVDCYTMCAHIKSENKEDTRYEYMYTYKYPEGKVPDGGEACYAKTLKKEIYGYNLDVNVLGIDDSNPYFDADVKKGKNRVIISSSVSQKYNLKVGDSMILTDEEENENYAFNVEGITQYSVGLYVFMNIDSMRSLFGESDDYYNVVFSDQELDIPAGRLYAVLKKSDIEKSSNIFIEQMTPMIIMFIGVSILILFIVMYLMMKVMIDRSAFNISLIKIFGYRMKEIKKLYLNGNFLIVAFGAAISIPISKVIIDSIYPLLISNVGCSMNISVSWQIYAAIYVGILLLYFVINKLLVLKLKKMIPAEVLKNRE